MLSNIFNEKYQIIFLFLGFLHSFLYRDYILYNQDLLLIYYIIILRYYKLTCLEYFEIYNIYLFQDLTGKVEIIIYYNLLKKFIKLQ